MINAILTDIEGTTTALDFVKLQLFPYAATHLPTFVRDNAQLPIVQAELEAVRALQNDSHLTVEDCIVLLQTWMKEDRKVTPLKTLQGLLWAAGYQKGELVGHIYDDVFPQLMTWHAQGLQLAIFSSGSVLAQKLLFAHTRFGDLTTLFSGYFDTTTGAKKEAASYQKIADVLNVNVKEVLFLSDSIAELDAAKQAGMKTCQLVREGCEVVASTHPTADSFYTVLEENEYV